MQLRGDYNSTSAVNSAAKTIVTITAPPAAAASASALHLGSSGRPSSVSTLTLASMPQSLLLDANPQTASVSAANTPLAAPAAKHASFGLAAASSTSATGHHVSFMPMPLPMMGVKRFRESNASLGTPTTTPATGAPSGSAPSLMEVAESPEKRAHAALELRQSVQSQITTLEDVENSDDDGTGTATGTGNGAADSDSEEMGVALVQTTPQLECRREMASSSSSGSVK
ncbi:hypothetical protein KR222_008780 [Zaprionus bogoriensis]|nr:hypothetical protein KR222_008780 [Zaprionus bogoriensis]